MSAGVSINSILEGRFRLLKIALIRSLKVLALPVPRL
jgi:hypothetical protein